MAETPDYDVVLSFAGEDRKHAEALYEQLQQYNVRVFYDNNEQALLWGKNLYDYLTDLYLNRAKFCVMFVSKSYAQRMWTNHERRVAQARAFKENEEYILPVKLDDTEIPGILSTIGYLSCPPENIKSIAEKIIWKLKGDTDSPTLIARSISTKPSLISERLVFKTDDSSIVKTRKKTAHRRALLTMAAAIIAGIGAIMCFFGLFVFAQYPSPSIGYSLTLMASAIVLGSILLILFLKNENYWRLLGYKEPVGRMGKYLSNGKFVRKIEDGNYIIYKMYMPCDYPTCNGTVYISNAPSLSLAENFFIGRCTIDYHAHTYKIDANGLATRTTAI